MRMLKTMRALVIFTILTFLAMAAEPASPATPKPSTPLVLPTPTPITVSDRSVILDTLLQYSLSFQKRENLYSRTIKPLDDDLAKIQDSLQTLLKPLERDGFNLDVQSCLSPEPAARTKCLTYAAKPATTPATSSGPSKESK